MPQTDQQKIIEIRVRYDQAVQGIAKYTQVINNLRKGQAELKKLLDQGRISQQQYDSAIARNREQIKSLNASIRALSKEFQSTLKEQKAQEGSLVALREQLKRLQQEYDNLGNREGTRGQQLREEIQDINKAVMEAEAATGRFQRNVGNYTGATNYLNTSVQQLVRELPSAAYGVNILISALSNNIGQLTDAIELSKKANAELKAQNKSTIPVWRQVLSSVVSWQTALMVGVTLLTMYGDKVIKWIADLFKGKQALDQIRESQQEFNAYQKKMNEDWRNNVAQTAGENIAAYQKLVREYNALGNNMQAKKKFITKNQEAFHNLGFSVNSVRDAENLFVKNTDAVVKALVARARAAAYEQQITDAQQRYINQTEYNRTTVAGGGYYRTVKGGQSWITTGIVPEELRGLIEGVEYTVTQSNTLSRFVLTAEGAAKANQRFAKEAAERLKSNNAEAKRQFDEVINRATEGIEQQANAAKQVYDEIGVKEYSPSEDKYNKQQETTAKKAARLRAEANKKALEEQQKADELLNKLIENNMERRRAEIATQYDNEIATLKNRLETEKNLNDDARKAMNSQIVSLEKIKNQELAKLDEEAIRAEVERETQRLAWLLEAAGEDYRKRRDIKLRQLEDEEKLEEARIKVEVTDEKERQTQLDALHQAFNARRKAVTDEYVKNTTDAQVKGITEEFTRQINSLGYDTSADIELKKAELELNKWLKIRANARQEDGESAEAYAKRLQEIDAQVTAAQQKYNQAQIHAEKTKWDTISSLTNSAAQLIKNFGNESKAMTALAKTLALAIVAINTGKAISEAIATHAGRWDFWSIAPLVAQILSAMTTATSIINSAKFATGGLVSGPGTGTSDSIPAMLSNGESVMTARATGMFAPLLSTLNQLGGGVPITSGEPTPAIGEEFLAAAIAKGMERMPRPVVSVEEINKVSKRVEVIERMGSV